jgi:hypothetical protein
MTPEKTLVRDEAAVRLAALAAGLCQDSGIGLEVDERHWAYDPVRRVILVAGPDLEVKGPEYCAGVLAHEVSHYYISRYTWLQVEFPSSSLLFFLLNGIEDPRVNTWIRRRYPGTDAWLTRVAELDMRTEAPSPPLADILIFVFECAREEWARWQPAQPGRLPPRVALALEQTRRARQTYAELLPPPDLDATAAGPDLEQRYREEVWPLLLQTAPRSMPTPTEQAIRLNAWQALRLAEHDILPAAARLLEGDIDRLASLFRRERGQLRMALEAVRTGDQCALEALFVRAAPDLPDGQPPVADPELRQLALRLIEAWLAGWRGSGRGRGTPLIDPESRESRPAAERKEAEPLQPIQLQPPRTAYDQTLRRMASQIDRLTRHIEEVLRPARRLHEGRGYPSGSRPDLRRLMACEADPREYNRLWRRKTIPHRRSTAVSLLIDLSGSMRGEKSGAALAGTVLLAESLHRLDVPFAINGFQDVLIPFCDFGEGLTPRVCRAIGELPAEINGTRAGGNNKPLYNDDGPCLLEAAAGVSQRPESDRLLVVVSDGIPEGRRSGEADLHQAVATLKDPRLGLRLTGIGLGPNTEHVRRFYPDSVANVPVEQFAAEIGKLLERVLLQ